MFKPDTSPSRRTSRRYLSAAAASAERRETIDAALSRVQDALQSCHPLGGSLPLLQDSDLISSFDPSAVTAHFAPTPPPAAVPVDCTTRAMPAIQPPPQLVSNGARPARLFYTAPRMAGVGHASYAATEPPFQHGDHGVQQLNDPSRASLLGELTDYLPSSPAAWRSPHEISHRSHPPPVPTHPAPTRLVPCPTPLAQATWKSGDGSTRCSSGFSRRTCAQPSKLKSVLRLQTRSGAVTTASPFTTRTVRGRRCSRTSTRGRGLCAALPTRPKRESRATTDCIDY